MSATLELIADLLKLAGVNQFRVRAYRNAGRTVDALPEEVHTMIARGDDLDALPSIGKDLAGKIADIATTGSTALLDELKRDTPPSLADLLRLPGLGPRRVRTFHDALGIENLEQLHRALKDGSIEKLPGFGARTVTKLLREIEAKPAAEGRISRAIATQYAEPLLNYLLGLSSVKNAAIAGSYRRWRGTVGDLDIVARSLAPADVTSAFVQYREVSEVISRCSTRSTVRLRSGLQVDLRAVPPESYGSALVYFTGSKAHNIAIRRMAQGMGLLVNEYGVFKHERRLAGGSEEEVYEAIGLPWIPPEIREDRGELAAALSGSLPDLIEPGDILGDLHAHTTATDGHNSLEEMAAAAMTRGYSYLAITDHSRHLTVAHGLNEKYLARQIKQIDAINRRKRGFTLLRGIEVDILEDGALDLPDRILKRLDIVVGAIHSGFNRSRKAQTERILQAFDNPHIAVLSHPTGRLIGTREPYDIDMESVMRKAHDKGIMLELNAHPERLDLTDTHCRMARDMGVMISIGTDAHSVADLDFMRLGIGQARRGWLEAGHVANTLTLTNLLNTTRRGRMPA